VGSVLSPQDDSDAFAEGVAIICRVVLLAGMAAAAALRLTYTLDHKDFLWYDSTQYIAVAQHAFFSLGLWSGSQPPLVPLLWNLTGSTTGFCALQSVVAVVAWSFLAWSVWVWIGSGARAVAGAWVVLAFSLSPFVLQWDASVLSESISLSALAVMVGCGLWLVRGFTWPRATLLAVACLVFELARDEGIEVVAAVAVGLAVIAVALGLRHKGIVVVQCAVLSVALLVATGLVSVAAGNAHRNVLNVENSLYVRVFPYPDMVAAFAHHGMPQARQIDAAAKILKENRPTPYAYASPIPSRTTALVVGPVITESYWTPLRNWITDHGESAYLSYLLTHPRYVLSAPFHRPSLAFNSPSTLSYYAIQLHTPVPGMSIFFPRRGYVLGLGILAAALLIIRKIWRRSEVALLAALVPLGIFAMAVGWFGDGQEIARHMIEGNVLVRLAVLLLVLYGLLAPANTEESREVSEPAT
jgi:hypothetical protein